MTRSKSKPCSCLCTTYELSSLAQITQLDLAQSSYENVPRRVTNPKNSLNLFEIALFFPVGDGVAEGFLLETSVAGVVVHDPVPKCLTGEF